MEEENLNRRSLEEMIEELRSSSIIDPYKQGGTPAHSRELIVKTFRLLFQNKRVLEEHVWVFLAQDYIELGMIVQDTIALGILRDSLRLYNDAKKSSTVKSLKALSEWLPFVYSSGSKSTGWLQNMVSHGKAYAEIKSPEELAHVFFQDVGTLTEGITQIYLRSLWHQYSILKDKKITFKRLKEMTLGNLASQFQKAKLLTDLILPPPWNIKINHLRNMAFHSLWQIESDQIVAFYGPKNSEKITINATIAEEIMQRLVSNTTALMLSNRIFYLDNVFEIYNLGLTPQVKPNKHNKIESYKTQLALLGFHVLELSIEDRIYGKINNVLSESDSSRIDEAYMAAVYMGALDPDLSVTLDLVDSSNQQTLETITYSSEAIRKIINKEVKINLENIKKLSGK